MIDVVSIVTKIRILKQITTANSYSAPVACCIYSNKDKNFKANHNYQKFINEIALGCIYSNKDKNFKANHNYSEFVAV